jgi:hypothetical protein
MTGPLLLPLVAATILLLAVALAIVPRRLVGRAQDRLAAQRLEREPGLRLLTRAELVTGHWRRAPGLLALGGDAIAFEGLFDETWALATSRVSKIVTGSRMASGRLLFRREVLRLTAADGSETEFVMTPESAGAWRSHLGLWAMAERVRDSDAASASDRVVPGRDTA